MDGTNSNIATVALGLIAFFHLALVATVAILWFGIPFRGNLLVLLLGLGAALLVLAARRFERRVG